jgi:diketogulonate reductase-like aldo/keto reductase
MKSPFLLVDKSAKGRALAFFGADVKVARQAQWPSILFVGAGVFDGASVKSEVQNALEILEQDALDGLVFFHPRVGRALSLQAIWAQAEDLVVQGLVHRLGVAHLGKSQMDLLLNSAKIPPAFNILEFHSHCHDLQAVQACQALGIPVYALHPQGPSLEEPVLTDIAENHGASPEQVALAYALHHTDGVVISSERAKGTFPEGATLPRLSRAELNLISQLECGWRIAHDTAILTTLYWPEQMPGIRVTDAPLDRMRAPRFKRLHLPLPLSPQGRHDATEMLWRNVRNWPASAMHRVFPRDASSLAQRLSLDLSKEGWAVTSVKELGIEDWFENAAAQAQRELAQKKPGAPRTRRFANLEKNVPRGGLRPLRAAADLYMGLKSRAPRGHLKFRLMLNPAGRGRAAAQQLWHSDKEDFSVVKVFIYLTDVMGPEDGALEYIPGTHPFGAHAVEVAELWRRTFVSDLEPGRRKCQVRERTLCRHVFPEWIRRLEGKRGTVVLLDARGLHRGGHALRQSRALVVGGFLAPNWIHPDRESGATPWALFSRPFTFAHQVRVPGPIGSVSTALPGHREVANGGEDLILANGAPIPPIAFGGGPRIKSPTPFEQAQRAGFRLMDTAHSYGNDHLIAGVAAEVTLVSKLKLEEDEESLNAVLENLGRKRLDFLLLHFPVLSAADGGHAKRLRRMWRRMERWVQDGRVGALGLSNTGPHLVDFILGNAAIPPVLNQVEMHPHFQQKRLLNHCRRMGIQVMAYAPLGAPHKFGKKMGGPLFDPVVADIARAREKTPAQIILRWHLQRGVIPVVSTTDPKHMAENLDVFDFSLSPQDLERMAALDRGQPFFNKLAQLAGLHGRFKGPRLVVEKPPHPMPGSLRRKRLALNLNSGFRDGLLAQ